MFARILVAVDGSESAKKAFEKSIYLAQKCSSKLDLVHVVTCELGGDSTIIYDLLDEAKIKAKKMLEEYRIEASKNNIPLEITITQGDAAKIIIEFSKKNKYDLIIMGTRGRNAFEELLLGSVSLKVIHHAICPVMVVR
jgi:nucleotide-binding universal stress UspA family protein